MSAAQAGFPQAATEAENGVSLASMAMYVTPPALAAATAELWAFLRGELAAAGLAGLPEALDTDIAHDEAWLQPNLLLSQTCGYPYVKTLRGRVRLVATPVYSHPGCDGPFMRSFIIVSRTNAAGSPADLRGSIAAINSPDSNSGSNLFRASVAPLAENGRFFAGVIETGSHGASIDAVSQGRADCAAIDCITFGNIQRFDPQRLAGVRVLAETVSGPGLPFITAGDASDEQVTLLRQALAAAIAEPSLATVRDTLGLVRFEVLSDEDYEPLLRLAEEAIAGGYSEFGA